MWRSFPKVPLIFANQEDLGEKPGTAAQGWIRCGLSLPVKESGTRKRCVLFIPEEEIMSVCSPFAVANSLVGDDSRIGQLLIRLSAVTGLRVGIFGSAALEYVSGYSYLTDTSDVDLIVEAEDRQVLYDLYHQLPELEHLCQTGLDIEVRFPGGRDVKLRELFRKQTEVLVKTVSGVDLVSTEIMWESLLSETKE